jgi:hypothetical protein
MTDNEIKEAWDFTKIIAINIGSATLAKEEILAIDDLINRQREEIERLGSLVEELADGNEAWVSDNCDLRKKLKTAKSEAIKEFAERLVAIYENDKRYDRPNAHTLVMTLFYHIDNLAKEMTEGTE